MKNCRAEYLLSNGIITDTATVNFLKRTTIFSSSFLQINVFTTIKILKMKAILLKKSVCMYLILAVLPATW